VWWSTPPLLQVNDRAGHGALHAGEALDVGDHELGQLVDSGGVRSGDDIVWTGQAGRLGHAAGTSCSAAVTAAALPTLVWIKMYAAITKTCRTYPDHSTPPPARDAAQLGSCAPGFSCFL
jgi:hypothetical protein